MKAVLFLQNAYSPAYAGKKWPRSSWLRALFKSHTGKRLKNLIEGMGDTQIWYDNTTPIVGESAKSKIPPDHNHIKKVLDKQEPDVVIALGDQAAKAVVQVWDGRIIITHHPAYRLANKMVMFAAGAAAQSGIGKVVSVKMSKHKTTEIIVLE